MPNRREFVQTGLGAIALGMLRRSGFAFPAGAMPNEHALDPSRPILKIPNHPNSVIIQGLPFQPGWLGDPFPEAQIPFHSEENGFPNGMPPAPTEEVDIAIVGGGLSGLSTAYMLRHRYPVVFELHDRFGGVSKGEDWADTRYSWGGAYFITPDEGSFLESFYHELKLDHHHRFNEGGEDPMELNGVIRNDFWTGAGLPLDQTLAFQRYAEIVNYFAENYPDIPLDEGRNNDWILELDQLTLKEDLTARMGMPIPPLLQAGIQSYCISSFNCSWDELSAASAWNFIAAEEFGRWVCPGGNAYVTDVLWKRLIQKYKQHGGNNYLNRLRPGMRAVDVRLATGANGAGKVQVTWKTPQGQLKSLLARRVVMANSKHICKRMMPDVEQYDPDKYVGLTSVVTNPYVVANVLLDAPIHRNFYDIFLLGDGNYPNTAGEIADHSLVVDMLNGSYAPPHPGSRQVLTLYWGLPWGHAVFTLITDNVAWHDYANRLVPQIDHMLEILQVPRSKVRQVRMTRWGHAMPVAYPGFIADGYAELARRPYADRVFFVNQDNWALPAFETCLLEAQTYSAQIDASL